MFGALRFLWNATRGDRLRPWRSPYLRWRMETYSGAHAETISASHMVQILWQDRRQFLRFLKWASEISRDGVKR